MNRVELSGTITDGPQSNEHDGILAASIRINFFMEATVTVVAVGAVAEQLCKFQNGEGILVSGTFIGKNGRVEILAETLAPHRAFRHLPATHNVAGPSAFSRHEVLPMRVGKKAKRHW